MNDKLSLQDLVEILYKKAKISKKEADLFFRELFQLILERIYENDPVKIKDFGTFKLTAISSRESVNVNTGAKIEIPAHFRLSFLPDKTLKGLVNEPFSEYETILLEDGVISSDIIFEKKDKDVAEKVEAAPEEKSKSNSTPKQPIQVPPVVKKTEYFHRLNNGQGKSFVYTYTSDTSDKSDEGVITLTFQKERLSLSSKIREDKLPVIADPAATVETEVLLENDNPEALFIEEETISITQDSEDIQVDAESIELIESQIIQIQKEEENVAPIVEDDDPDRPLIPDDIDYLDDESEEEVDNQLDDLESELDEEAYLNLSEGDEDDEEVTFEDMDGITMEREPYYKNINKTNSDNAYLDSLENEDTDINDTFYKGGEPNLASKIRKRVFIIIFFLLVVCFVVYSFLKLFNVKYDYEKYLGNKNFILADTLPFVQDADPISSDKDSVTISPDTVAVSIVVSDTSTVEGNSLEEIETLTTATILDSSNEQKTDSLSQDIDKIERRISDRLDINIVNKAQLYLKKNQAAQENEQTSTPSDREVVKKEDIERVSAPLNVASIILGKGMTLRSLSNKYYGNPTYWVYIYEANKKKLSNPNDISVGMRLLIPNLSNYGVSNVKDSKEIQKASRLEAQLLNY